VLSKGREAAGKLLVELQVRKSTADAAGARDFYTKLTTPITGWEDEIRNMVLQKKLVRPVLSRLFPSTLRGISQLLQESSPFIVQLYHHCRKVYTHVLLTSANAISLFF